jgi:hypothetical protein
MPKGRTHRVGAATKADLPAWLEDVLRAKGGSAAIVTICREIWQRYEPELRFSGDLFYTWQYDVRWAAHKLREAGIMKPDEESPTGVWELA